MFTAVVIGDRDILAGLYFIIDTYHLRIVPCRGLKKIGGIEVITNLYRDTQFFLPFPLQRIGKSFAPLQSATGKLNDPLTFYFFVAYQYFSGLV